MNKQELQKYISTENISVVEAMEKIDRNAKGILFIADNTNKLVGSITDGDIRRWIIKTGFLGEKIGNVMQKSPKFLFKEELSVAEKFMNKYLLTALPVLNHSNEIVDILFYQELDYYVEEDKKNLKGIPVVIMAGGKGTRLYPYTKILPKPLIPIGDTPIIERIIDSFVRYNIDKYYLTVNYKKGMIKSYFDDLNPMYDIEYVEEDKPLGTGGSIKLIKEKFDTPIFVTNCDTLIFADYDELYKYHIHSQNDITIVSALKKMMIPYGVLHTSENGQISTMEEKPTISYFINTGMYIINPELISRIPDDTFYHMTDLVTDVLSHNGKVGLYPISEYSFLDMGELDEMRKMEERIALKENKKND